MSGIPIKIKGFDTEWVPAKGTEVWLIDCSFYFYRSFYKMPELQFNGIGTGHIYGLGQLLMHLYKRYQKNDKVVGIILFDTKATRRLELFPKYKKGKKRVQRKKDRPTPKFWLNQELYEQMISVVPGCYWAKEEGLEADDLIAYLIKSLVEYREVKRVNIITNDYDIIYLANLDQRLKFYEKIGGEFDPQHRVYKKHKLDDLSLIPWFKMLYGDESDNIPQLFDKRTTKKIIAVWKEKGRMKKCHPDLHKEEVLAQLKLNKQLISHMDPNENFCLQSSKVEHLSLVRDLQKLGLLKFMSFILHNHLIEVSPQDMRRKFK